MKNTDGIYVGTYGKYAAGSIYGKWFRFDDYADAEDMMAAIAEYHKVDHDPEYMVQDYEDDSGLLGWLWNYYGEGFCVEMVELYYDILSDLDCLEDAEPLAEYCEHVGINPADYMDGILAIEDNFLFELEGPESQYADEIGFFYVAELGAIEIPPHLDPYFDYERYGRDLMYDLTIIGNKVYQS